VFNLKARDDLFRWDVKDRGKRLVNVLDAYVLGAVPPYNMILGGKLVSCLVRSREVRDDFAERYGDTRGIISRKKKKAQLVVITTSSSLGRSSVYNRLKIGEQTYFRSIGFTQGWGHFHVPDTLFAELRDYLRKRKHKYVNGHKFGEGPNPPFSHASIRNAMRCGNTIPTPCWAGFTRMPANGASVDHESTNFPPTENAVPRSFAVM